MVKLCRVWRAPAALAATVGLVTCLAMAGCSEDEERKPNRFDAPHDSVRITESVDEWLAWIEQKAKAADPAGLGYTECASVEELPGAHVCGSSTRLAMNDALIRASLFAEGDFGAKRGAVVSREAPAYRQGIALAAGHDLRAEQLVAFWEAANRACEEKARSIASRRVRGSCSKDISSRGPGRDAPLSSSLSPPTARAGSCLTRSCTRSTS
jgi:hypothetical protein